MKLQESRNREDSVYKGRNELKRFKNGYGTIVVSTSKGVIANDDAYRANVGGEALCSIW